MKEIFLTASILSVAFMVGNFLYQLMVSVPQWNVAIERSFFQTTAIFVFAYIMDRRMHSSG